MKKEFKSFELKVIVFEQLDVITASGDTYFDNELPMAPFTE